jgi:hypothetical protein
LIEQKKGLSREPRQCSIVRRLYSPRDPTNCKRGHERKTCHRMCERILLHVGRDPGQAARPPPWPHAPVPREPTAPSGAEGTEHGGRGGQRSLDNRCSPGRIEALTLFCGAPCRPPRRFAGVSGPSARAQRSHPDSPVPALPARPAYATGGGRESTAGGSRIESRRDGSTGDHGRVAA